MGEGRVTRDEGRGEKQEKGCPSKRRGGRYKGKESEGRVMRNE